jgi:hypothetical protein
MDRTLLLLAALVSAPFIGLFVYNGMQDPVADQRSWIEDQLAGMVTGGADRSESQALPAWHESMLSRPTAWETITTPPPPPEPPKPQAPKQPDVRGMLQGLVPTKSQIGAKIKMITPQNERGEWFVLGDVFNGCELIAIEKTEVVFSYDWREGNKKIEVRLPRGSAAPPRPPAEGDAPPPAEENAQPQEEAKPAPKGGKKPAAKAGDEAAPPEEPGPPPGAKPKRGAKKPPPPAPEPAPAEEATEEPASP